MRHVVPIDRQPCSRQVRRTRESHSTTVWKALELARPSRCLDDATDTFGQADRANVEVVGRERFGLLDNAKAKFGRIDRQRLGDLVELDLLSKAALRGAVA